MQFRYPRRWRSNPLTLSKGIWSSETSFGAQHMYQSRPKVLKIKYSLHARKRFDVPFQPPDRVFRAHVPDQRGSLAFGGSYVFPRGVKTSEYRVRRQVCTAVGYCIVRGSACRRLGLDPCLIAAVRPTNCCRGSHPLAVENQERKTNGNGTESRP